MRCLELEDRKIFFDNWLRLLAFVNDKYNLVKYFGHPKSPVDIKPETMATEKHSVFIVKCLCMFSYILYKSLF